MDHLFENWLPRVSVLLIATLVLSFAMMFLHDTAWAESIREVITAEAAMGEGEAPPGRQMPVYLIYVLPAIKVLVMMGVPMLLCLSALKLHRKFLRSR